MAALEYRQPSYRRHDPGHLIAALILILNVVAPSSDDVRGINYVVPVVPRVTGRVTEAPIEPNRPIKKGDVLFKIDPVPFELDVQAAEANLAMLRRQVSHGRGQPAHAGGAIECRECDPPHVVLTVVT